MDIKSIVLACFLAISFIGMNGCDNSSSGMPSQSIQTPAEPETGEGPDENVDSSNGGGVTDNNGGNTDTGGEEAITLTALTVLPTTSTLTTSEQVQFIATASYSDDSSAVVTNDVIWESDNTDLMTVINTGLGTAIAAGNTIIRATLTEEGETQSSEVAVNIMGPSLTSITVSPKKFLLPASVKKQLTATAQYSDGTTKDITSQVEWSVSETVLNNPNPVSGSEPIFVSVDPSGVVICHEFDGNDDLDNDTTITATFNDMQDTAELTVFGSDVVALNITPAALDLRKGLTQQFTATALLGDREFYSSTDVTHVPESGSPLYEYWGWRSSDPSVVEVDRLTGLATVLTAINQPVEITFERGQDVGDLESGIAMLQINDATLDSISIAQLPSPLTKGTTENIQILAHYSDGITKDISTQPSLTLTLSDESIVDIVNSQIYASRSGTTDLIANFDGVDSEPSTITVVDNPVVSVSIEPSSLELAKGTLGQLTAIAAYDDGTTRDVTNEADWATRESDAVSVNSSGKVMTNAMPTNANSVLVSANFRGHSTNSNITVKYIAPQSLAMTLSSTQFTVGEKGKITLIAMFSDGSEQDVTELAFIYSFSPALTVTQDGVIEAWIAGGGAPIIYGYGFSHGYTDSGEYLGFTFSYDYGYNVALPIPGPFGFTEPIIIN